MKAIIVLIILGIILAGGFLAAFIWAVRSGQYDDDYTPSVRMLFENKRETTQDVLPSVESDEQKPSKDMNDEQLNQ
ncbi:MAG TPA: cbb3-type cytochrome oxidase assembly protein CcoS [Bacteroidales bacterium]|nr:cbb3-type cytochrome oxidase assembly protein CcoS [Bacteroidales bacterium]